MSFFFLWNHLHIKSSIVWWNQTIEVKILFMKVRKGRYFELFRDFKVPGIVFSTNPSVQRQSAVKTWQKLWNWLVLLLNCCHNFPGHQKHLKSLLWFKFFLARKTNNNYRPFFSSQTFSFSPDKILLASPSPIHQTRPFSIVFDQNILKIYKFDVFQSYGNFFYGRIFYDHLNKKDSILVIKKSGWGCVFMIILVLRVIRFLPTMKKKILLMFTFEILDEL